jgi:hypothetical protein
MKKIVVTNGFSIRISIRFTKVDIGAMNKAHQLTLIAGGLEIMFNDNDQYHKQKLSI